MVAAGPEPGEKNGHATEARDGRKGLVAGASGAER